VKPQSTPSKPKKQPIEDERFQSALDAIESGAITKETFLKNFELTQTQKTELDGKFKN
jgi:hypothetical protein